MCKQKGEPNKRSFCCLILTLWFWNAQYEDTQLVHHMQQTLSVLQETALRNNQAPYIVLVGELVANDLYLYGTLAMKCY